MVNVNAVVCYILDASYFSLELGSWFLLFFPVPFCLPAFCPFLVLVIWHLGFWSHLLLKLQLICDNLQLFYLPI